MKYEVILNGKKFEIEVEEGKAVILNETAAEPKPQSTLAAIPAAAPVSPLTAPTPVGTGEPVNSPLPGSVISVKVSAGQTVKAGDTLVVIEAMKMENEIAAPRNATVSSVAVSNGQSVESGTPLVYLA